MTRFSYQGNELDLFQQAVNWKRYFAAQLQPYISGDVLEVGAGIGGTSRFLCAAHQATWTCLEPDIQLADRLQVLLTAQPLPVQSRVVCGTINDLAPEELFDTLLFIDVLEHIENDREELARSALRLRTGGHLIVMAPAHNGLFSPFDRQIGHYRRYNRRMLARTADRELLSLIRVFYLDSAGVLASLANRAILRSSYPTPSQIRFWDSTLVRISRRLDPLLGYRVGKTVIAVWRRNPPPKANAT
jgi:SAM-dependent methyltransferase